MNVLIGSIITVLGTVAVIRLFNWLVARQEKKRQEKEVERYSSGRHVYYNRHVYFNPNPNVNVDGETGKPERWHTGDCAIRAFCGVLDLPWERVYDDLCWIGADCHDLPNSYEVIDRYAKEKGLVKRILRPQSSVSEFAGSHDGTYLLLLKRHAVCVKGNRICDTGDCGHAKVRVYYEKGGLPAETAHKVRKRKVKEPSAIEKEVMEEFEKQHGRSNDCFSYFNPNPEADTRADAGNPSDWSKADNVIRALCGVLDQSWDTVYFGLCRIAKEMHDIPDSRKVISRFLKEKGFVKKRLPSQMPLSRFAASHDGVYLVQLSWGMDPQLTCVKDNHILDIWDFGEHKIMTYYERLPGTGYMTSPAR